jgi:Uma2 family endonuclease
METIQHLMQMLALIATLRYFWRDRSDYFVGGNLTVYFSPRQKKSEDFRGPDFFVVLGVDGQAKRSSWVVWEEGGKYPNLILEILSESTKKIDRGEKKAVYQDIFRTPEYFLFDPETGALEGFRLAGGRYQVMEPSRAGYLWSEQLELFLGVIEREVRFFAADGNLVLKPEEDAEQLRQRAEQEQRRADREQRRADREQRRAESAEAEAAALRSKNGD